MLSRIIRTLVRLHIVAPLGVFNARTLVENRPGSLVKGLRERKAKEAAAIREFIARVSRDPELNAIIRHYQLTEEGIEGILDLLVYCGLSAKDIAIPFVFELCAHSQTASNNAVISAALEANVRRAFKISDFVDDSQRERFSKIFGPLSVRRS